MNNDQALQFIREKWFSKLKIVRQNDGPAKGTIGGALIILEKLYIL